MVTHNVSNFSAILNRIDIEDLEYVERDLCFYELVSMGFLLYGEERTTAEFLLQKLLVLSNNVASGQSSSLITVDIFRNYATSVNKTNWREHIVEALAIINARRVIRKLGFNWDVVRQYYLPHIPELSLHIHPLLKGLYRICETMTQAEAGRLILHINENHTGPQEHLRFYDSTCLEVYLLYWITRRIISVGDRRIAPAFMQVLFEYFKLNDLEALKTLLETIISNTTERTAEVSDSATVATPLPNGITTVKTALNGDDLSKTVSETEENNERYDVCYERAGFVLIINQKEFYEDKDRLFEHLLPKKRLGARSGTDVDKARLREIFQFYGYKPIEYDNLSHIEMLHYIRETAKRSIMYDSMIVCILSHGFEGSVYGCNSVPVKISEIESAFKEDSLESKPKILIIQACQTDDTDSNVTDKKKVKPDRISDMIKAMSTVPGFPALRHTKDGSWFIQSLCDAIHRLGERKHFSDILTAVTNDVSQKRGETENEVMLPMQISTSRKSFFLPKRNM